MPHRIFDMTGRVIVVTGETGVSAGSAADHLASVGAKVIYIGRNQDKMDEGHMGGS